MDKHCIFKKIKWLFIILIIATATCKKDNEKPLKSDIWDIDKDGIPQFAGQNYIETEKIEKISKFRSSVGHDYSDAFEHCRSMKHYFVPKSTTDWSWVKIYAPVTGILTRVENEWAGVKIEIASEDYPAFRFSIFHLNPVTFFAIGDTVNAGQMLGTHIGTQTMSDISVIVNDPTRQGRMVSYFDVITDAVFSEYQIHGITSRNEMIISKETRDANPLTCNGDTFISTDTLENWVVLDP